jgi:hypothetical protein
MPHAYLESNWCGFAWTEWAPFENAANAFRALPILPGIYRVQAMSTGELAYIGQTGRPLRERLGALRLNTLKPDMPWNDPHTAAPALWSYRDARQESFACSVAPVDLSTANRCALECYVLWRYRAERGSSTLCNFGRLFPGYRKSRNRSTGDRGGRVSESGPVTASASLPALVGESDHRAVAWMGLPWSVDLPLSTTALADVQNTPGVYRLIDRRSGELLYIGESSDLRGRLQTHTASDWDSHLVACSYCLLPMALKKAQRLEVENDLIGAYFHQQQASPIFQFQRHLALTSPAPSG